MGRGIHCRSGPLPPCGMLGHSGTAVCGGTGDELDRWRRVHWWVPFLANSPKVASSIRDPKKVWQRWRRIGIKCKNAWKWKMRHRFPKSRPSKCCLDHGLQREWRLKGAISTDASLFRHLFGGKFTAESPTLLFVLAADRMHRWVAVSATCAVYQLLLSASRIPLGAVVTLRSFFQFSDFFCSHVAFVPWCAFARTSNCSTQMWIKIFGNSRSWCSGGEGLTLESSRLTISCVS